MEYIFAISLGLQIQISKSTIQSEEQSIDSSSSEDEAQSGKAARAVASLKEPLRAEISKMSVQVPASLCIHPLFSRNSSGNNGWPLDPLTLFVGIKPFILF